MLNKFAIGLILFVSQAHATTIEQLAKKNNELLDLKADLAIAKTKEELAKTKLLTNPAPAQFSSTKMVMPKPSPTQDIDSVEFIGAGGDANNAWGKFLIGNAAIQRRQGEAVNGWLLVRVTANDAMFTKAGKTPKDNLQKIIYLSATNRLNERRPSVSGALSQQGLYVPAVNPQQPPLSR